MGQSHFIDQALKRPHLGLQSLSLPRHCLAPSRHDRLHRDDRDGGQPIRHITRTMPTGLNSDPPFLETQPTHPSSALFRRDLNEA